MRSLDEIDGHDAFRDLLSERGNFLVFGVIGIEIERRPVRIRRDQSGVERSFEVQNVGSDIETKDVGDHGRQGPKPRDMVRALLGRSFRLVFPTDYVRQHRFKL